MKRFWIRTWIVALFFLMGTGESNAQTPPIVTDPAVRQELTRVLRDIGDWAIRVELRSGELKVQEKRRTSIFINSNLARVLLAGYEIHGGEAYLQEALAWFDRLVALQQVTVSARGDTVGWWGDFSPTANIYLGDAGTSATALAGAVRFTSGTRREAFLRALHRYAAFVRYGCAEDPQGQGRGGSPGWIISEGPDRGALGTGYYKGKLAVAPYTIATSVTGCGFFSALYGVDPDPAYIEIAEAAGRWLLQKRAADGHMPYTIENRIHEEWPINTLSYVSDGLIGLYRRTPHEPMRAAIGASVNRNVNWLINQQNGQGVWGKMRSEDQQRSQGAVNLMILYYSRISPEQTVLSSLERNCRFFIAPGNLQKYGVFELTISTGFVGLSIAELLEPGITYRVE
ncbi:MAG TPA: hypothetical protein PKI62_09050 [bacterium]|nr:hypothetical protein [bacterium]HPR88263.1 hypothetical protein [bacterium]